MILHEILYPFKNVVMKNKTNKLMIFALFHSPFMVFTFLKFWIWRLKSNPNTHILSMVTPFLSMKVPLKLLLKQLLNLVTNTKDSKEFIFLNVNQVAHLANLHLVVHSMVFLQGAHLMVHHQGIHLVLHWCLSNCIQCLLFM